jgi:thiamine-phosphate pyrophosphorylase
VNDAFSQFDRRRESKRHLSTETETSSMPVHASTHPALRRGGLYAVTDGPRDDLIETCEHVLRGGATLLQYRDDTDDARRRLSEAQALAALCVRYDVPLLVENDVALAAAVDAGVHISTPDGDIPDARDILGPDALIGVSCHNSLERARDMARAGASYLSFGAFYPSSTKPGAGVAQLDTLRQAAAWGLPLVAIGGITTDNGRPLLEAGADYLAVVAALFGAPNPELAAQRFTALFAMPVTETR